MADLGIVVVGPEAGALRLKHLELPVHRVCVEPIVPLVDDMPDLARESALAVFQGPDADRWRMVPRRMLPDYTEMLWAASQVASSEVARVTDPWKAVLVIAWPHTTALIPVLRSLGDKPVTVLLGGRPRVEDPAVRRNHVVLAELMRASRVTAAVHVPEPDQVLGVAVDAARKPTSQALPRRKAIDIGPHLDLGPTWAPPAAAVPLHRLVHVPLGQATKLPQLLVDLAAYQAVRNVFTGPPIDVEGFPVHDLDAMRDRLPPGDGFQALRRRVLQCLDTLRFAGEQPLVDQIAQVLHPAVSEVRVIHQICDEIESNRILRIKAFGAAGVGYIAQRLRSQLDDLSDNASSVARWRHVDLDALMDGELELPGATGLAWRREFAGVPSYIVKRNTPGWMVAREMVQERFKAFRAEFATAVAEAVDERIRLARDSASPLPREILQTMHDRAVRVRDALQEVLVTLNGRVLAGCEIALRQDGVLRWVTSDPEELRQILEGLLPRFAVNAELERTITMALTRRPLGMASKADFSDYVREIVEAAVGLSRAATNIPTYADLLRAVVDDRDPEALRFHLTSDQGMDPVLSLQKNTPPELMAWFQRTGMTIEVRSGDPCAIYWGDGSGLSSPVGEFSRNGAHEHQLEDLVLAPPDGDTSASLAILVESVVLLLTGLVVGELQVAGEEGVRALLVTGAGLPPLTFLPHGVIHHLASDAAVRGTLSSRVFRRLDALPRSADSEEALLKLVELAALGPSPRVQSQIGLDRPRFRHLLPAVQRLLARNARRATVSMIDHMRAEEILALTREPKRHAIVDVLQLSPLGVG